MGFFDTYQAPAEPAPKVELNAHPSMNLLSGECTLCGALDDNVMFGACLSCSGVAAMFERGRVITP